MPGCKMRAFGWRLAGVGATLLAIVLLAGCLGTEATPTPVFDPPVSDDPTGWHFESADTGRRLRELDACAREVAGAGWRHLPYAPGGNFYEARWCTGPQLDNACMPAGNNSNSQHTIRLYTLFTPDAPQTFFGLGLAARWSPPGEGWSAQFSFDEEGRGVIAPTFSLWFAPQVSSSRPPTLTVALGPEYAYRVQETTVTISSSLPLRDDLARYLVSADAMRDLGLQNLGALEQKVTATVQVHQATACDHGTPPANGGAPPCLPRPLTAAEEQEALASAATYFAAQTAALRDHYQEMRTALLSAFPLDRCWH